MLITLSVLALVALALGIRRRLLPPSRERLFLEFYLVVAAGLLISSVTWEFYLVWLLPVFLGIFLAPARFLPASTLLRALLLAAFALCFVGLNYPGDFWLFSTDFAAFDPEHALYHPDWVPGVWVEDKLHLYHNHLDAIVLLRVPSLLLVTSLLGGLVVWHRRREELEEPVPAKPEAVGDGTPAEQSLAS
jgi:hypothetical protein